MKKHIPNFITSLNLASGFIAAIYALSGNLATASWLILAAMIFDFLDGLSARILKAYSDIGKELDSLADVVSFGVAPALIVYKLIDIALSAGSSTLIEKSGIIKALILYSPVIMPVCAALRLAIFNLDDTQKKSFKGLPTPANALAVISVVIAAQYSELKILIGFTGSVTALVLFTAVLSLLMVTRLPLLSLKTDNLKFKGNEGRFVLILMVVAAFAVLGLNASPLIIPLYIAASLLSLLFRQSIT
jgi:CDP-diacylglycerol--serine O-phosphatidyltransferase